MTKTFCDRCGKEILTQKDFNICSWIRHRSYCGILYTVSCSFDKGLAYKTAKHYICPECEESYIHWFMNPDKT